MRKRVFDTEQVDVPLGAARVAQRRVEPILRAVAAQPWTFDERGQHYTLIERLMLSCYLQGAVDAIEAMENHGARFGRQPEPSQTATPNPPAPPTEDDQ